MAAYIRREPALRAIGSSEGHDPEQITPILFTSGGFTGDERKAKNFPVFSYII